VNRLLLKTIALLGLLLTGGFHSAPAQASDRIRCDSRDFRQNFCPTFGGGSAYLHRQRSNAQCIEGVSWGFDGRNIWVSQGCSGEFIVDTGYRGQSGVGSTQWGHGYEQPRGYGHDHRYDHRYQPRGRYRHHGHGPVYAPPRAPTYHAPQHGGYGQIFRCESRDSRVRYCGFFGGHIDIARQLSRSPCIYGHSWGVDRRGLWVAQGCRAEFVAR
jgi:hypothetical protein